MPLTELALVTLSSRLTLPAHPAVAKPKSSRNSSIEAFVVCRCYSPPPGFAPAQLRALLQGAWQAYGPEAQHRWAAAGQRLLQARRVGSAGGRLLACSS